MFYYWDLGNLAGITFAHIAQRYAVTPEGKEIVEYYKPTTYERVVQYHSKWWKPFKYFTIDDKVFELDPLQRMYNDRSFGMHDVNGKWTSGVASTKFTPISPEEAAEKAIYFLNLNTGDPWPLSNSDNMYWDGDEWCGNRSGESLFWDDNDCHIMIPFSEIPAVLKSFGVTND